MEIGNDAEGPGLSDALHEVAMELSCLLEDIQSGLVPGQSNDLNDKDQRIPFLQKFPGLYLEGIMVLRARASTTGTNNGMSPHLVILTVL